MGWDLASIFELANSRARAVAVVDTNGDQIAGFDHSRPANSTLTSVTVDNTVGGTVLAVANPARRGLVIMHDNAGTIFVALNETASATVFTYKMGGQATLELPLNGYTGEVRAFRSSGTSTVRVTEITS